MNTIGKVSELVDVSTHTLRYYEKIGLLPEISKDGGGRRIYAKADIERVRFIKRAQRMQFSLDEIRQLLALDNQVSVPKQEAQALVSTKLADIEENLQELKLLKKDLNSMLSQCIASGEDENCPIIDTIKEQ